MFSNSIGLLPNLECACIVRRPESHLPIHLPYSYHLNSKNLQYSILMEALHVDHGRGQCLASYGSIIALFTLSGGVAESGGDDTPDGCWELFYVWNAFWVGCVDWCTAIWNHFVCCVRLCCNCIFWRLVIVFGVRRMTPNLILILNLNLILIPNRS